MKRSAAAVGLLPTGDVRLLLARYADLALAALVVSIVGMMIVPLPTPRLDLLISVNIAAAVTLLLVAIYDVPRALTVFDGSAGKAGGGLRA